jgi:polysaccharide pyruvyl transferase WcaK-like protein
VPAQGHLTVGSDRRFAVAESRTGVRHETDMAESENVGTKVAVRRIVLFGAFGAGNLGNECTLQSLLHHIRQSVPRAEVSCICTGPEETEAAHKIPASLIKEVVLSTIENRTLRRLRKIVLGVPVELYRWFKAIARLKGAEMLIMTGTGMLSDFGISPFGLHYEILKWTVAAKLCRCRVIFLSVGVGPLRHPVSRRFVRLALSQAEYRSYRDQFSKHYLESIGFNSEHDEVYPDLVYSFPAAMLPNKPTTAQRVVGVGLMAYSNKRGVASDDTLYRQYISKLADFVVWLLRKKYTVRLLIGDVVYDEQARHDLKALLEERANDYDIGEIVDEPAASVDDVLSQIAATDFVVASRFHNVLLALLLDRPVLALSYHEKVEALMVEANLGEFCQDIESINVQKMIEQFSLLEEQSSQIKQRLEQDAKARRAALDRQYDHIFRTSVEPSYAALQTASTNGENSAAFSRERPL